MDLLDENEINDAILFMKQNTITYQEEKNNRKEMEENICKEVKCKKCNISFLISFSYHGNYPLCKKHRLIN